MKALAAFLVVVSGLAAVGAYLSMFIVHVNEQAVVLTFGSPERQINQPNGKDGPGLYYRIPFMQTVDYFDKRILDLDLDAIEVNALDQKRLVVDAFGRYRITDPLLFYQSVRNEAGARERLKPIVEGWVRGVLGEATFQEIVSRRSSGTNSDKRESLMKRIAQHVNEDGKQFGLEVVDVRIKRADLPKLNQKNVYERMRAERKKEADEIRAEGVGASNKIKADADRQVTVIKAEATRDAERIKGEGDAERNRIFAEAFNRDPDFFAFYRSMQAYEAGMKSGDKASETRMLLSPDSEFFRYFNNPNGSKLPGAPTK
jgi:modulator of FtsH protease HflC